MINIGDVKLQSLTDDHGSGHVLDIFPDSDLGVWETKYSELLHNDNHIQPRFGSTFLYSQGKNILVDTGGGPPSGKLTASYFPTLAPDGAAVLPRCWLSEVTSTSIVLVPLLLWIILPLIDEILANLF